MIHHNLQHFRTISKSTILIIYLVYRVILLDPHDGSNGDYKKVFDADRLQYAFNHVIHRATKLQSCIVFQVVPRAHASMKATSQCHSLPNRINGSYHENQLTQSTPSTQNLLRIYSESAPISVEILRPGDHRSAICTHCNTSDR